MRLLDFIDKGKRLSCIPGRIGSNRDPDLFSRVGVTEIEFNRLCQSLEPSMIPKLYAIVAMLKAENKFENCKITYVDVRSSIVREVLEALDLSYLEIEISDSDSVDTLADNIVLWGKHMEFVLKHVLQAEYELCRNVFDKFGSDISMSCFEQITAQSGFLKVLGFGNRVAEAKKDAVKLLKLLDVFAVLDKLRLDFNKVFGGKACLEIQNLTRDLVKRVVDGACEIFFELSLQVEIQGSRMARPPIDGGVPRFMDFVVNYCVMLFQDDYRLILSQVLSIHQIWNQETSHDIVLREEFRKIIKSIEINLETWSKTFEDTALSYFFLMNNYRYLHGFLKGTTFVELMGDDWLNGYVQRMDYYAEAYMKESWGKLPAILSKEGLMLFFPDRTTNEDLVKGMLREFNSVLEEMCKRQSEWILLDIELREKAHQLIVQAVVPAYRSFLHNYAYLIGKGLNHVKHLRYSVARLEAMLRSLFQPRMSASAGKHKSFHMIGSGQTVSRQHQVKEPKISHSSTITTGLGVWIPCG